MSIFLALFGFDGIWISLLYPPGMTTATITAYNFDEPAVIEFIETVNFPTDEINFPNASREDWYTVCAEFASPGFESVTVCDDVLAN